MRLFKVFFFTFGCLYCCTQAFSSWRRVGLLSGCGTRASHCGGFSCGATGSRRQASEVVAQGLIGCDLRALEYLGFSICGAWASFLCGMWNFPGPKIEPMSPSLVGTSLTTLPPGEVQVLWTLNQENDVTWRRKWQPTPVFLPGKSHGQRSLVGYSTWGRKELGSTQVLNNNSRTV